MSQPPSSNGANGRDKGGRFAAGNPGGPGNPHAAATAMLRAALVRSVTEDDIQAVVAALVQKARSGDVVAIRELLDRTIGKPSKMGLVERVETLERQVNVYIPDNGRGPARNCEGQTDVD